MDATSHDTNTGELHGRVATVETSAAAGQLKSMVERIERLSEERDGLSADIRDIYAEARGNGFNPKALRKVVAERKKDRDIRQEEQAMFDLYWDAVN
jgi:uncharacterized protein (UPF0335 family)